MEAICAKCGTQLNSDNSRNGASLCIDCECAYANQLMQTVGLHVGIFYACIANNLPCVPLLVTEEIDTSENVWLSYLNALAQYAETEKGGADLDFFSGVTDIRRIFGKNLTETTFSRCIEEEQKRLAKLPGTPTQRQRWGLMPIWDGCPLTSELYDELDRLYNARIAQYKGVQVDEQMNATIIRVIKLTAAQDYLQSRGEAVAIDKIQKTIESMLASEQLRKKDEKPVEKFRIDSQIVALEKSGAMEDGKFLTCDEVMANFAERYFKSKKYSYSIDVADHLLLDAINSSRANADLMQLNDLPDEYLQKDEFGECEPNETEDEIRRKKYAGLTKIDRAEESKGGEQ